MRAYGFTPWPDLAFQEPPAIAAVQDRLLRRHVAFLAERSPFYRRLFKAHGVDPRSVQGCGDLATLPLTGKEDLERCSADLQCVPDSEINDLCLTSGTVGRPVALPQTAADLERLAYNEAQAFAAAGLTSSDRVLIAAAIDRCFMAGLAYFLGLNRLGALAIRGGSSSIPALAELVRSQRPTAIVGVPSLLVSVAARLAADGIAPIDLGVDRLICIGEPVRDADLALSALGRRLAEMWGGQVYGTYASTEMATAFGDCSAGRGGHLQPELMAVEIVDENGRTLSPGTAGEVVATPLQVTGMPLLRFRTGDIAVLHTDACPCGRHTPRLGPVLGRKAQMLKYRGTTVFPPAILAVLQELDGVRGAYIEVFDDYPLSDRIRVVIGAARPDLDPAVVAEELAARLRVKPEVVLADPDTVQQRMMQPDKRKPVNFFDYRSAAGRG